MNGRIRIGAAITAAAAMLALAGSAVAQTGQQPLSVSAQQSAGDVARGDALNKLYHLGKYRPAAPAGPKRRLALAALATALAAAATVQVASGVAKTGVAMGSLTFEAVLRMTSRPGPCPPGAPPDADLCSARIGSGAVRGLGGVSETYSFFVGEGDCDRVFETTVRLEVAGKGELQLAVERYRGECISSALNLSRAFTITGGSGIYAGASGGGTVTHRATPTGSGSVGTDTWTGTLNVPGLEFDVTPPTLSGAVNKEVRARRGSTRVRVPYRVTASDAVDGSVPVSCRPRSGSLFKIGRTFVECSATDTSANAKTGRFRVTVKRG